MSKEEPSPYEKLYNKAKWRTLDKYLSMAKQENLNEEEAKKYFDERVVHDKRVPKAQYIPIVSKHPDGYQMDTFINNKEAGGLNYLMFININTRKAYAYPMNGKGAREVLTALHKFVNDVPHVYSITSDEDAAYLSSTVLDFMREKNIKYRTTTENNHNVLGIINRFMRTIRDAIGENRFIQPKEMHDLVNIYNNSPHRSLDNKAPNDITPEDEIKYIQKNARINPYHFNPGEKVRLVLEKEPFGKRRSNLSNESYIVDSQKGNQFVVKSKDGSTSSFPGYRLLRTRDKRIKVAERLNEGKEGIIEKIYNFDEDTGKYDLKWEGVEGDDAFARQTIRDVRRGNPLVLGTAERQYWLEQKKNYERQIKAGQKVEGKPIPDKIMKYI